MLLDDVEVLGPREFTCKGVRFRVITENYNDHQTNDDQVIVLKGLDWFEHYAKIIDETKPTILLELGIWEGGSSSLFALLFPKLKVLAIDFAKPKPAAFAWLDRLGLSHRVKLQFSTSQDDSAELARLLDKEAPNGLDLVIDDASHHFEMSQRSFEILFPRLLKGGSYIIEDWAWAHQEGAFQRDAWIDRPALSNLIFKLVMLAASRPELLVELTVMRRFCAMRKAGIYHRTPIELDNLYLARGKALTLI